VYVLGVGIEAAAAALQRVARLNVHAARVDALDGDLRAFAAIGCRVDGHSCSDGSGGRLLPVLAVSQDADAVIDHLRQIAVTLGNGDFDYAVVERPASAVVGEGYRRVDCALGDLRQRVGGLLRNCTGYQDNCQG